MARVQGYTEDEVDVLVADMTLLVQQAVDEACAVAAANLKPANVLVGASTATAHLGPEDVAVITQAWQEQVDDVLVPYVAELHTGSAVSVAVGMVDAFPDDVLPGVPLVPDSYQVAYLQTVSNRLVGVGDELWEDVRNELLDGVAAGQSIEQLADRVRGVSDFDSTRAVRIARTEVHGAAEAGSLQQVRYVGYDSDTATKEWVSTHDIRTRMTHSLADGQQVPLDDPFNIGGSLLQFPGDPSGPADEIINCRCTTVFELDVPPKHRCDGALVAAPPPDAAVCVAPLGPASIGHLSHAQRQKLYDALISAKKGISPAYGGAAIHKALQSAVMKILNDDPALFQVIDQRQFLAAADAVYKALPGPKSSKTFLQTFDEWSQTPNGKKAIGPTASTPTHATTPISVPKAPVITELELPPIQPRVPGPKLQPAPDPEKLKFVKSAGGGQGAFILEDTTTGDRWLFKERKHGTYSSKYTGILDVAAARIQSKAYQMRPAIYDLTYGGQKGTVQFMFHADEAFPGGKFEPMDLPPADIAVLQMEQIFDWMIGNHDTHTGQWIRLENGRLYGVDKGQAFKFFGKDKLDWDYAPVHLLPGTKPTYATMWKAFVAGDPVDLQDPTTGPLGAWIDRLTGISDAEYRKLLTPYALAREKAGFGTAAKFLDDAVARKNNLKADFAALWARAVKEREKSLQALEPPELPETGNVETDILMQAMFTGVVDPSKIPAKKVAVPSIPVANGVITGVPQSVKTQLWATWQAIGGGKKVTPAYGGAKIWKQLQELKSSAPSLTYLQVVRILDEMNGSTGKPKTYESVLRDWLNSPPGKKAVPIPPPGLKELPALSPDAPAVKPIVSKAVVIQNAEAKTALEGPPEAAGDYSQVWGAVVHSGKYSDGDVVAYAQTNSGDVLRVDAFVNVDGKNGVHVLILKNGKWEFDEVFIDLAKFELHYDLGDGKPLSKVWHLVSPKKPTGTLIAGKSIGDDVTPDELWAAHYNFKDGEVLATSLPQQGVEARLVSDGAGGVRFQSRVVGYPDWTDGTLWNAVMIKPAMTWNSWKWKLGGDAKTGKPKKSVIADKNVGDVVTTNDLWYGTAEASPGDVAAYAQAADGIVWRLRFNPNTGVLEVQRRPVGSTFFAHWVDINTKSDLDTFSKGLVWHIAKLDGGIPDELVLKTPTKYPGIYEGGEIDGQAMVTMADQFDDFEIIARGAGGAWDFRVYKINGYFVREARMLNGAWEFDKVLTNVGNPAEGTIFSSHLIKWFAANGKAEEQSVSAKAAKKAVQAKKVAAAKKAAQATPPTPTPKATPLPPSGGTLPTGGESHFPGLKVGDLIDVGGPGDTNKLIWDNFAKYPNGTVIATRTSYGGDVRLVVVDGRLVVQEKTAAGAWKNTQLINNHWQIPTPSYGSKWVVSADELTKAQLKAATTYVQKKLGTYVAPTVAKKKAQLDVIGDAKRPVANEDADISGLSEADLGTVLMSFKGVSYGQLLGAPPEDMLSNMWAWAVQLAKNDPVKFGKITTLGIARAVDEALSKKMGKANSHLFENKVRSYLQTQAGKDFVEQGKHKIHPVTKEVFATDVDGPKGVTLRPGEKYQRLPGPGPYDPSVPSSAFAPTRAAQMTELHDRVLAATRPLAAKERQALKNWTSGAYHSWSGYLRDKPGYAKPSPDLRSKILYAQSGMRPVDRDLLFLRGTGWDQLPEGFRDETKAKLLVGRIIEDPGFFATSTSVDFGGFGGVVQMEVEVPKGTMGAWVKSYSHNKRENEFVLPAGSRFHVISVTSKGYGITVRVRVVS